MINEALFRVAAFLSGASPLPQGHNFLLHIHGLAAEVAADETAVRNIGALGGVSFAPSTQLH
jgi:hypothetical protein